MVEVTTIRVSFSTWKRFVQDYLAGLLRRAKRRASSSLSYRREAVHRYFANISPQEYLEYHTSMNSDLFLRAVSSELKARVKPGWSIVDMGAGFCDLEDVMASELPDDSRLISVDLHTHMLLAGRRRIETDQRIVVFCLVTDVERCALSDESVDMVVCVNVTPYLKSLNGVSKEIGRLLKKEGELILVQPRRNPFWEEEFEGVKLSFFNDGHTVEVLGHCGLTLQERREIGFCFLPFLRHPSTTYASMLIFRKLAAEVPSCSTNLKGG